MAAMAIGWPFKPRRYSDRMRTFSSLLGVAAIWEQVRAKLAKGPAALITADRLKEKNEEHLASRADNTELTARIASEIPAVRELVERAGIKAE